jgi:hypothetical protein
MAEIIKCRKVCKFRLELTELEALELDRTAGVARFIYNWALERCQEHYQQHKKGKPWNELSAELTQLKKREPWLYDFDAQSCNRPWRISGVPTSISSNIGQPSPNSRGGNRPGSRSAFPSELG